MSTTAHAIGIAAIVLAVAFQFGLLIFAMHRGINVGGRPADRNSTDWQVRCTRCNSTVDAKEAGLIRLGGGTSIKRARCDKCQRKVWVIVERVPAEPDHGLTRESEMVESKNKNHV